MSRDDDRPDELVEPEEELADQPHVPEPPSRWKGEPDRGNPQRPAGDGRTGSQMGETGHHTAFVRGIGIPLSYREAAEFRSARKLIMASQIMAIISLFIGGILLSSAALVAAVLGRNKLVSIAGGQSEQVAIDALKRSGTIAVAMSAIVLSLNVVALFFLYPVVMEAMQSGNMSSLWGSGAPSGSTSTNGGPLFG